MGDPTRSERILAPADAVIAYGVAAAANLVARALGQTPVIPEKQIEPLLDLADFLLRAMAGSEGKEYVTRARSLWLELTKEDPSLVSVAVMDLNWWTANVPKTYPSKKAIAGIGIFDAWTNSSTLVLVSPSLFEGDDKDLANAIAKVLLRHESKHVKQFRDAGDRPPATYRQMADYEGKAYGQTAREFKDLGQQNASWKDAADQAFTEFQGAASDFAKWALSTDLTDLQIRDEIIKKKYLPEAAPPLPAALYVP
jgi:hypothetical protein